MDSDRVRTFPDGLEYLNGQLESFAHPNGRIVSTNGNALNAFRYAYHLTDHLGNVRLVFANLNGNGRIDQTSSTSTNEILQENHYYPFGMTHYGSYSTNTGVGEENRYRYNGMEFNEELGLYAYGARYYDPTIGRFTGVDPIADQFPHVSTYNYAENDPIVNIDLHGLQKVNVNVLGQLTAKNGQQIAVAGGAQIDIGNQNRVDVRLVTSEGDGISFSYSQSDGVGLAAADFGPSSFDEAMFKADRPGGVVIPGLGLDIGLWFAADAVTPDSQEEADQISPEEKQLNSQIRFILNTVGELNDQGLLTPLFDRDGTSSGGTNSNGETYTREFGNVYRGSMGDFEFTESGISFKGKVIISYTDQRCTSNCDE